MKSKPFNLNAAAQQSRVLEASKAMGAVAASKAEEIVKLNQQAAQKMTSLVQEKVTELLQTSNPKSVFDMVHAQILQDAAKEVVQYQTAVLKTLGSGNQELVQIAQAMVEQSKEDLIHFVNEATENAPIDAAGFNSAFKDPFRAALQNFELMRAAMADSFGSFEKNVENMTALATGAAPKAPAQKRTAKKA
jgi:Phasin protein